MPLSLLHLLSPLLLHFSRIVLAEFGAAVEFMQSLPSAVCNEILSALTCASAWKTGTLCRSLWSCLTHGCFHSWEFLPGICPCWQHMSLKALCIAASTMPALVDLMPWNPDLGYAGSTFLLRPWYFTGVERSDILRVLNADGLRSTARVLSTTGMSIDVCLSLTFKDGSVSCRWSAHGLSCQDDARIHVELSGHIIHPCNASVRSYGVFFETGVLTDDCGRRATGQIIDTVSNGEPLFCGLVIRCSSPHGVQEYSFARG